MRLTPSLSRCRKEGSCPAPLATTDVLPRHSCNSMPSSLPFSPFSSSSFVIFSFCSENKIYFLQKDRGAGFHFMLDFFQNDWALPGTSHFFYYFSYVIYIYLLFYFSGKFRSQDPDPQTAGFKLGDGCWRGIRFHRSSQPKSKQRIFIL